MRNRYSINRLLIILAMAFILNSIVFSQEKASEQNAPEITMDEFQMKIAENHPLFQRVEYGTDIIEVEKRGLLGSQDMNISAETGVSHFSQISQTQPGGLENSQSVYIEGGIEQLFWESGGILSADVSMGNSWYSFEDNPMYSQSPDNAFENSIYITYIQPLMKNYKGLLYSLPYEMKDIEIEQSRIDAIEAKEALLAENTLHFLDWAYYKEENDILEKRRKLAKESLEQNQRRRRSNLIDEVDVIRAEASLKAAELQTEANRMNVRALTNRLQEITGDDKIAEYNPKFDIFEMHQLKPVDSLIAYFIRNSRSLTTMRKTITILEKSGEILDESLKDDLSLVTRAGLKQSDKNFIDALIIDQPDVSVSLSWQFPRGKTSGNAEIEANRLKIEQFEKQIEETEIGIISSIRNIHSKLSDMQELLGIYRQQIELAEKQTREELELYRQGRNDYVFVIQSQDAEESARLNYLKSALNYQKLYIQLESILDKFYKPA
ncbi:MAG: TolC family protein [Candidatus Zixiibacteriota bacterium]